jgi:polyisoprenoid-binding protein YceI
MKKFLFAVAAMSMMAACNNAPDADKAETAEATDAANAVGATFKIDTTSVLEWLGTKPVGQHNGTMKIADGSFAVENGTITGGSFTVDVNSLTDTDMKAGEGKEKLEEHLKSADFFDVAKYPTAKFEITAVEVLTGDSTATHKISGNLTLKDSTKNVTFPAMVSITETSASAKANFNIDRTQWGMFYGNDQSLGDKFIRPEVNIKLNISATKQ